MTNWHKYFPECDGKAQSPVNVNTVDVEPDLSLGTFTFHNFDSSSGVSWNFLNNGHSGEILSVPPYGHFFLSFYSSLLLFVDLCM